MARWPRLPGRRHLAVFWSRRWPRTRWSIQTSWAGRRSPPRPRGWRSPRLAGSSSCTTSGPAGLEGRAIVRPMNRLLPDVVRRSGMRLLSAATSSCCSIAGRRHDLAHGGAGRRLHPVAAERQAAAGPGRRLRHRHAHQRAAEAAPALDLPAGIDAHQALRDAPGLAHPPRPLGGFDRRHGQHGEDFLLPSAPRRHGRCICASPRRRQPRSCARRSTQRLPPDAWFHDVHGSAPYKRHVTFYLAEQIRAELS